MKAIVYREYGGPDVLRYEEVEKPAPKDDEVLIKVQVAAVNPLDWRLMSGKPAPLRFAMGLRKPRSGRPGVDVAGQVETVGKNVTQFKPGDAVFGSCNGAFAEYACAAESKIAMKPASLTFEDAASVNVAGLTALQGLRDKGKVHAGSRVLVNGAAGGVGTFAVQLGKHLGAQVTGVCSRRNVDMVWSLGADEVIDYTRDDFTRSDQRYDVILDCVGNPSFSEYRRVLKPEGRSVGVGAPHDFSMISLLGSIIKDVALSASGKQKSVMFIAKGSQADLNLIGELIASGKVKPVIDKIYPLSEAADAVAHVEAGHARGKVLIRVP